MVDLKKMTRWLAEVKLDDFGKLCTFADTSSQELKRYHTISFLEARYVRDLSESEFQ